jgi:hypothetical protein
MILATAAMLAVVLGKEMRYVDVAADQYEQTLFGYGAARAARGGHPRAVRRIFRPGGGDFVTRHVRDVTGSSPRTLEEFVRDHGATFIGV